LHIALSIDETGLESPSTALIDHARFVDRSRLRPEAAGRLIHSAQARVDRNLARVFGLARGRRKQEPTAHAANAGHSLPIGKDIMDSKEAMPTSTLTSKGQITIPKELRDQLHLKKGSRLEFVVEASGRVILQPFEFRFPVAQGMIRSKRRRPVSIEEMNEAIASGYSGT